MHVGGQKVLLIKLSDYSSSVRTKNGRKWI